MRENRNTERNHETSQNPSELARKEQDHRHKWQDNYLKNNTFTFRSGQVFGFIYNMAVLALVYDLIQKEQQDLAIKIFFGNIALIIIALLITTVERRIAGRKPRRGGPGRDNRRFHNNRGGHNRDRDNRDRGGDRGDRNERR